MPSAATAPPNMAPQLNRVRRKPPSGAEGATSNVDGCRTVAMHEKAASGMLGPRPDASKKQNGRRQRAAVPRVAANRCRTVGGGGLRGPEPGPYPGAEIYGVRNIAKSVGARTLIQAD